MIKESLIMENKKIQKIVKVPLREIWQREDKDFTKWLEKNIDYLNDILGFEFSVISSEESVGPYKVDLYGEDMSGDKVVVENQLERTDHTHLGQIITYLTNLEAKTAIWITSDPKEEHSKAIDWLNEITPDDISFYLVKLEAVKIGEDGSHVAPLFTVVKRPTQEKKQLGAEKKEFAERHVLRLEFWTQLLNKINSKYSFCRNISPKKDNWISIALGMSGVSLNLVVTKNHVRSEVYINRGNKEENKKIFDYFYSIRNKIEKEFGDKLIWNRMEDNITSAIEHRLNNVDVSNKNDWDKINDFLINNSSRMFKVFKGHIKELKSKI